jgi:hypothetical protein
MTSAEGRLDEKDENNRGKDGIKRTEGKEEQCIIGIDRGESECRGSI